MCDQYGKGLLLVDMTYSLRGEGCYHLLFHKKEIVKLCKGSTHYVEYVSDMSLPNLI